MQAKRKGVIFNNCDCTNG